MLSENSGKHEGHYTTTLAQELVVEIPLKRPYSAALSELWQVDHIFCYH